MDQRYPSCAGSEYTRRVRVELCSLRQDASIDRPSYRYATYYDVDLGPDDFQTLDGLKRALQSKTKAGFLKTQFFRIRIKYRTEDADSPSTQFLSSSKDVRAAYEAAQSQSDDWSLFIVRYTKAQSVQLQAKVPQEEYQHLRLLLGSKRKYERHVKVIHDISNYSVIKVSNKEGIIHTDDYVDTFQSSASPCPSISSTTSMQHLQDHMSTISNRDFNQQSNGRYLMNQSAHTVVNRQLNKIPAASVCESEELLAYVNGIVASAGDSSIPLKSLVPISLFQNEDNLMQQIIQEAPCTGEENDNSKNSFLSSAINERVERIKLTSPVGKLFSARSLKRWAIEIMQNRHLSYEFPPSYFPLPDAYETRGFKHVAVGNHILGIVTLYATYLSQKYPVPRGYNANEYKYYYGGPDGDADADVDGEGYCDEDDEDDDAFRSKTSLDMHLLDDIAGKGILQIQDPNLHDQRDLMDSHDGSPEFKKHSQSHQ